MQILPKDFEIKRLFFVDNVRNNDIRGLHAHYSTEQLIFCASGKLKITCSDGKDTVTHILDRQNMCVYIPKMIWDEQVYLTKNTMMISIANTVYNPDDYINSYDEFLREKYDSKN